ncbi:IclR family transcriptional regulator [Alcaligenaceae bacterium]|nr:IclR family transcriptional regulator [Alcaligenaceae bacterium]
MEKNKVTASPEDSTVSRRRKRYDVKDQAGAAPKDKPATSRQSGDSADRQYIVALARGMEVLGAFRAKEGPLGNHELSERTGIPAATVSRITYTLSRLGFLEFNPRQENYELGGSTLALGQIALARRDIRKIAAPLMQQLAEGANANVGLGIRDRRMMIYIETCEGSGLVGLRLFNGSRIPLATSAMGRAYLSAIGDDERRQILDELRPHFGTDWAMVMQGIEKAARDMERDGYCTSCGEWQRYINGAGTVVRHSDGALYGLNIGGPSYILSEDEIRNVQGPRLVEVANKISDAVGIKTVT